MRTILHYLTDARGFGVLGWVVVIVVVVVVTYVAGSAGSNASSSGDSSGARFCFTKCGFFKERRCEDNAYVGFCFPFWPCSAENGTHECVTGTLPNERKRMASETCQF
jgi:hypothetical protein